MVLHADSGPAGRQLDSIGHMLQSTLSNRLACPSEWPRWTDCQRAVTQDQSPNTVFNTGQETEYQTIFTVYSSKGQQIMYKPVNKHDRADRHPTQAHAANRNRDIFLGTLSKREMVGQCQVTIKGRDGHQAAMDPYRGGQAGTMDTTDPTMQNRSHPLMRHFNTHLEGCTAQSMRMRSPLPGLLLQPHLKAGLLHNVAENLILNQLPSYTETIIMYRKQVLVEI